MLTGMQDFQIDIGIPVDNPGELCDFDEVRAGADDEEEVLFFVSFGVLMDVRGRLATLVTSEPTSVRF